MKRFNKIIIILTLLSGFVSCDYLDTLPPNIIDRETVFSNESSVTAYLAKLYSDIIFDDFKLSASGYDNEQSYYRLEYYTGYAVSMPKNDVLDKQGQGITGSLGYSNFDYGRIRNVNDFLKNIAENAGSFDATKVKGWIAEARVIRAWYYFNLAKRYGGLPLITEPQEVLNASNESLMVARSSEKETWDFIIADIDYALANGIGVSSQPGRINRFVAHMLKAQAALFAASIARYGSLLTPELAEYTDLNTGKQLSGIPAADAAAYYRIAFDAADSVVTSNKYALARNLDSNGSVSFAKLFVKPESHSEALLVEYFKKPLIGHRWSYYHLPKPFGTNEFDNPTLNLIDLYDNLDGTSAKVSTDADGWTTTYNSLDEPFKNRDYRLGGTVYYPGSFIGDVYFDVRKGLIVNGAVNSAVGNVTVSGTGYSVRGKYGMGDAEQTASGFMCRKYIDENNVKNVSYTELSENPWLIMRYAEALLIQAECAAELGQFKDKAKKALDDIRTRAGLPALASENDVTIDEVRKQWVCEFAFENTIFWCSRRWRTLDKTLTGGFKPSGLEPYWDITNNKWKFKKVSIGNYPKISFLNKYYYNQIDAKAISTNPKIIQNYGY